MQKLILAIAIAFGLVFDSGRSAALIALVVALTAAYLGAGLRRLLFHSDRSMS